MKLGSGIAVKLGRCAVGVIFHDVFLSSVLMILQSTELFIGIGLIAGVTWLRKWTVS
jgi:hypothetical protein